MIAGERKYTAVNSKAHPPCLLAFISQVVNYCAAGIIPGQWLPVGQQKIFQLLALCSVTTFPDQTTQLPHCYKVRAGRCCHVWVRVSKRDLPEPVVSPSIHRSQTAHGGPGHVSRPIVKNAGVPRRVSSQWNCARVAHSVVCGRLWSVPYGISARKFFMLTDATSQIFLLSVSVPKDG